MVHGPGVPPGAHVGVGVAVPGTVGVAVAVGVAVGVGDGVAQGTKVAVSCWPLLTGGLCPPVRSHPYCVKMVSSRFTPTTNWLSLTTVAGVMEPYMYRKG